jgi:predicted lipoprotein
VRGRLEGRLPALGAAEECAIVTSRGDGDGMDVRVGVGGRWGGEDVQEGVSLD